MRKFILVMLSVFLLAGCGRKNPYAPYDDTGFEGRTEGSDIIGSAEKEDSINSEYKDIKKEIEDKKKKLAAEQPPEEEDAAYEKEMQEYIDISSRAYKASAKFMRYLSLGDYEGVLSMLDVRDCSAVTAENVKAAVEATELKRFVGSKYTIDSCASKVGEKYAYMDASCKEGTSMFRLVDNGSEWKVDLQIIYNFYMNDMDIIFPGSDKITIDGVPIEKIKAAPDRIDDRGQVHYDMTFPVYGVTVKAEFDGFGEKELLRMFPTDNSALYIYLLDEEDERDKIKEGAINAINTLFDGENEDRFDIISDSVEKDRRKELEGFVNSVFEETELTGISFRDMEGTADTCVTAKDTFLTVVPVEVVFKSGEDENAVAKMNMYVVTKKESDTYKVIRIDADSLREIIEDKAEKVQKGENEEKGEDDEADSADGDK